MKELIHKNCGGRIFISVSDIEGLGEGYCAKCNETIDRREQINWEKSESHNNVNQEVRMKEIKNLGKHYRDEVRKKLHFRDLKIPKLTAEQIEHNVEMIASEDEDYILLFQEGFITKPELAGLLLAEINLD